LLLVPTPLVRQNSVREVRAFGRSPAHVPTELPGGNALERVLDIRAGGGG
jgi:hypothetical protein